MTLQIYFDHLYTEIKHDANCAGHWTKWAYAFCFLRCVPDVNLKYHSMKCKTIEQKNAE